MIKKIAIQDIPGRLFSFNNRVEEEIMEFWESGWDACEVTAEKYKNIRSAYATYKRANDGLKLNTRIISRDNRLFIVRTAPDVVQ